MDDYDTFTVTIDRGIPHKYRLTIPDMAGDYIDKLSSDIIVEFH